MLLYTQAGLAPEEALPAAVLRRALVLGGGAFWLRAKPRLRSVP